jgi:hypothetical protein
MSEYRKKNEDKLKAYARKYYAKYNKGEKYSSKDHKGIAKSSLNDAILHLHEYNDANLGIIPGLFELIKDLGAIADKFNKLTTEEDFL